MFFQLEWRTSFQYMTKNTWIGFQPEYLAVKPSHKTKIVIMSTFLASCSVKLILFSR